MEIDEINSINVYTNTTINTNNKINEEVVSFFENQFWEIYPKKPVKGIKHESLNAFKRIPIKHHKDVIRGLKNYSQHKINSGETIHCAERFLKKNIWKAWIDIPVEQPSGDGDVVSDSTMQKFVDTVEGRNG